METTLQATAVSENSAGAVPVSRWQKAAGVLIVIASVLNLLSTFVFTFLGTFMLFTFTFLYTFGMCIDVLYITAFVVLVFKSASRQVRKMTSVVLVAFILLLIRLFIPYRHYMDGGTVWYLISIISILAYLMQMYAVSVMIRVDENVSKENFVMSQLWVTSCLISGFVIMLTKVGMLVPVEMQAVGPMGLINGVFGVMAAVSWKRIARTRLFAGKGQELRIVPYSPLNKFMGGPFICASVIVLPLLVITLFK